MCGGLVVGRGGRVNAVGMCGLGPCVLPADADGRPLRPAILYGIDSRAEEQVERLTAELGAGEILARCGSRLSSQSVGPKSAGSPSEEPQVWSATRRVFGAGSYLAARLTGEYVLDHHSASHWAPLYDVHENAWIDEWVAAVAPGLALPRLVWPHEECGSRQPGGRRRDRARAGTPVAAGTTDSWAEVAASGLGGPAGAARLRHQHVPRRGRQPGPSRREALEHRRLHPGSLNIAAGVASAGALTAWLRELSGGVSYTSCTPRPPPPGRGPAASSRCPTSPASARRCSTPTCAARSSA